MDFQDYYKILGVSENASATEIKASYRKLARKYHPDVSKEANAEENFKSIGEAYDVLKNPDKRAEYDQLRRLGAQQADGKFRPPPGWRPAAGFSQDEYSGENAQQFSDFFESMFGKAGTAHRNYSQNGTQRSFRMRGQDIHYKIALFLEEAQLGCQRQITLRIPETDEYGLVSHRENRYRVKTALPITLQTHVKFNPNLTGLWFGGVMEIMEFVTMLSIILTGAALIREREHGTIEHLLVMPLTPFEIMMAKVWSNGLVVLIAAYLSLQFVVRGVSAANSLRRGHPAREHAAFRAISHAGNADNPFRCTDAGNPLSRCRF